ncbi:hypothetical protein [Paraburkholderia sp. MM5477-R1]|uniref:hypothetical protein n=1 Tax=Paraburkholderia sp. MM5477-R1 TaxID=2991062 RepID=UPI003D1F02C5
MIGYEQDDGLSKKGSGDASTGPLYGSVLSTPSAAVESRLRAAGSSATVRTVIPLLLTAVICSASCRAASYLATVQGFLPATRMVAHARLEIWEGPLLQRAERVVPTRH